MLVHIKKIIQAAEKGNYAVGAFNVNNLEIVTNRVNSNRKHLKSTSKYTGVSWHKNEKKWQVMFRIDNKLKHFGYFENEIDAKNVYQKEINKINSTRC